MLLLQLLLLIWHRSSPAAFKCPCSHGDDRLIYVFFAALLAVVFTRHYLILRASGISVTTS